MGHTNFTRLIGKGKVSINNISKLDWFASCDNSGEILEYNTYLAKTIIYTIKTLTKSENRHRGTGTLVSVASRQ